MLGRGVTGRFAGRRSLVVLAGFVLAVLLSKGDREVPCIPRGRNSHLFTQ